MAGPVINDGLKQATSSRAGFVVASPDQDEAIRRLLRQNPMPGSISISLEREPGYFRGANIGGADDQTILVLEGNQVVCMGRCTFRDCWINGTARRVGYLGELRLDASARGRFDLIRRGYQFFQNLSQKEPADCYFTSIAANNDRARRLLESGQRGLPDYKFLGEFVSLLITVPERRGFDGIKSQPATPCRLSEMVSLLNEQARRHELAAHWTEQSLEKLGNHGLPLDGFRLVWDGGRLVACGALWDQRSFRQVVIRGYAPALLAARPLINILAPHFGVSHLPAPGSILSQAYISPLAIEKGRESILPDFIESFFPLAAGRDISFLTLGLPALDPRLPSLRRRFSTRSYQSRLYLVSWKGRAPMHFIRENETFFPDIALL